MQKDFRPSKEILWAKSAFPSTEARVQFPSDVSDLGEILQCHPMTSKAITHCSSYAIIIDTNDDCVKSRNYERTSDSSTRLDKTSA